MSSRRHSSRIRLRHSRQAVAVQALYGPHLSLATKAVVSVFTQSDDDVPLATRTWTTVDRDIRNDLVFMQESRIFVRAHGATGPVGTGQLMGCPHQEGIDYPMGRTCPQCPAWAGIDRFTHEPIRTPVPVLSVQEVLAQLSKDWKEPPYDALDSADAHRAALLEPLLAALDRGIADAGGTSEGEATLFSYALYLMAKWREPRAYSHVVRWLSLPGEGAYNLGGDIVFQDGPRILAAVYDGTLEPIKTLIVNRGANEFCRSTAADALALLGAWLEVPLREVIDYFVWLTREGLEREPNQVWNGVANCCADIEALDVLPELRRAHAEGLIDPRSIHPSDLDDVETAHGRLLESTRERRGPIDDVAEAIGWWSSFADKWEAPHEPSDGRIVPIRTGPKVGRNEPCPCGSGKKYKKCCGLTTVTH